MTSTTRLPAPPGIPPGPAVRRALGVVAPFDMELDAELWRWLPGDVDVLMTRTPFIDDIVSADFARALVAGNAVADGARSLIAGRADVVAYACTSGSFVAGVAGEAALRESITATGAREAVTASGAILEALAALGATRVAVATPYTRQLSDLLAGFLAESGIGTVRTAGLGLERRIWEVSYETTAELARAVDHPEAQAIVLSCTNLPSYDLIAPLEAELGKPVVSANQATMWAALHRMGAGAVGPGQALLEVGTDVRSGVGTDVRSGVGTEAEFLAPAPDESGMLETRGNDAPELREA